MSTALTASIAFGFTLVTLGCGAAPATAPAANSTAAVALGPGRLDPTLARGASTFNGVHKMKLRISAEGQVEKLAVYHRDAAAVPDAVKALAAAHFQGATVEYYEHEHYADVGEVFEVEVKTADGRHCEVSASAAGALIYEECELPVAEVPAPVTASIEKVLPGGKLVEAERKKGPSRDEFSLEVEHGGRVHYLRVGPEGAVLAHHLRIPAEVDVPLP